MFAKKLRLFSILLWLFVRSKGFRVIETNKLRVLQDDIEETNFYHQSENSREMQTLSVELEENPVTLTSFHPFRNSRQMPRLLVEAEESPVTLASFHSRQMPTMSVEVDKSPVTFASLYRQIDISRQSQRLSVEVNVNKSCAVKIDEFFMK